MKRQKTTEEDAGHGRERRSRLLVYTTLGLSVTAWAWVCLIYQSERTVAALITIRTWPGDRLHVASYLFALLASTACLDALVLKARASAGRLFGITLAALLWMYVAAVPSSDLLAAKGLVTIPYKYLQFLILLTVAICYRLRDPALDEGGAVGADAAPQLHTSPRAE